MSAARMNLIAAVLALAGGFVWTVMGEAVSGLIWMSASAVWLALAIYHLKHPEREPLPMRRLARRLSRLLLFS